jgi:type IV pilus assembly protein PilN
MKFKINLATRIYINARLLKLYSVAAAVLFAALLSINIITIGTQAGKIKSMNNEIMVLDDKFKTANKGISEKQYNALLAKISFANTIIDKKIYNWLELLDRLELVVPDGVAITSIEPDSKGQILKLAGIARGFKNLRVFMEHLEDSKYFTEVYLTNQGEVKLDDATQGISFSLTCKVIKK